MITAIIESVLLLGGFHSSTSFCGSIGHLMTGLKADYTDMRTMLEDNNWSDEFVQNHINSTVEEMWASLRMKLYEMRDKFVPCKTISGKPNVSRKGRVPLNEKVRELMKDKDKAHR